MFNVFSRSMIKLRAELNEGNVNQAAQERLRAPQLGRSKRGGHGDGGVLAFSFPRKHQVVDALV